MSSFMGRSFLIHRYFVSNTVDVADADVVAVVVAAAIDVPYLFS